MMGEVDGGNNFKRYFWMFLASTMIESKQHGYSNLAPCVVLENVALIRQKNWCEYLYTNLIKTH